MPSRVEFPFPDNAALPTIPIILSYTDSLISTNALLDTGSTVNLLPYDIGLQLGAIWEEQTDPNFLVAGAIEVQTLDRI